MIDLRLGDCLEILPTLPEASIDLILADLPYGTTACKWDVLIPFEPLWACYRRLLKPRGAVVLTASQPFTSMLVMSNREWFKYCLIWEKSSAGGFLDAKFRPLKAHEDIIVFSRSGSSNGSNPAMTYSPQMGIGEPYFYESLGAVGLAGSRSNVDRRIRQSNGIRYPRSILYFPSESAGLHPTQKPVALMEYLIRTYSNEGETVLDNTMGSGTTALACINTERHFIGIEQDPAYFAIAERRIAESRLPLFAESESIA